MSSTEKKVIDGFEMMLVNSGTFKMGAQKDSEKDNYDPMASKDEKPVHQVTLTRDYYIGVYPVTQKQWMDLMGDNPSIYKAPKYKEELLRPVESVNFFDVQGFISRLNQKTGKNFRLPTEAEWEYAARGGYVSKGYYYSGSSKIDDVARYSSNAGMKSATHAVGTKEPNELGLYDMSGNVREWVNDIDGSYTEEAQTDPAGPQQLANAAYDIRVTRGGHYLDMGSGCRVSARESMEANKREEKIGFRLALTAETNSPRRLSIGPAAAEIQAEANVSSDVEVLKQKVKANLDIIHAGNANMAKMMMNVYSGNPSTVDVWGGILQATEKEVREAKQKQATEAKKPPAGTDPAIEAIKQEVKSRIEATYGPANPAVNIMFNSFINNPEAGKLEFWQKVRESVGGEAAPLDPKREQKFGDWNFIEDNGTITIVSYYGYTAHVEIPAQINGKPVTCIGDDSMDRYDYINSVTIPNSVTTIEKDAFKGNEFMRHLTIPDSVESIGECAFDGCNLLSVTFGKGLKTIGKHAFNNNQLAELVIPDNVTSIGYGAFDKNFIYKLTIGKGLTVIPERAFEDNKFTDVIIPNHIKEVGDRAFNLYRGTRIITDAKIKLGKDAFGHAKIISASSYAKEMAEAAKATAAKKAPKAIDEKSKVIDLSDDNPPICGRGWVFADGIYTIHDWANVTITGDNKKSGRRIVVEKGARKVNITLQDAVISSEAKPAFIDASNLRLDEKIPLRFLAPVTLWLKGKNAITTGIDKPYINGKDFKCSGIGILCEDLVIGGTGSLDLTGSIICDLGKGNIGSLTVYGGKIGLYYGGIKAERAFTMNGGELFIGTRTEKEYSVSTIRADLVTINGGTLSIKNNTDEPIYAFQTIINGGDVTAINDSWSYQGAPANYPAIGYRTSNLYGFVNPENPIVINGGNINAIVPTASVAAAIGKRGDGADKKMTREEHLKEVGFHLIMTGGVLTVSHLVGRRKEGYEPSELLLDKATGGQVFHGQKQVFNKPDIRSVSAAPELVSDIFEYVDERPDYKVIDGFEMMRVRKGTFMMGATADQGWDVNRNEKPAHQVTLARDYYICLYPVTQKQWADIMGSNPAKHRSNFFELQTQLRWSAVLGAHPSRFADSDFYPIECVSHINAREFIVALNKKTGRNFRLPTEAEWEFAARGGLLSKSFMYAGSNDIKEVATSDDKSTGYNMLIMPTGAKDCNELGIYDMSGTVKEWVNDIKGEYTQEAKTDPLGPEEPSNGKIAASVLGASVLDGSVSVKAAIVTDVRELRARSGADNMPERIVRGKNRVAARYEQDEHRKYSDLGFRLVLIADN